MINASDGVQIDLDDLDVSYVYNGDGTLNYAQVSTMGNVYRQTYTYTSGRVSLISRWVKQ